MLTIADAAYLKGKYDNMFLASSDQHTIVDLVSSSIKKEFGVIAGSPNEILPQIKKCKHLSK